MPRIVLVAVLCLGAIVPAIGLSLAVEAARTVGLPDTTFLTFIGAIAVLGTSAVVVGITILWRKPGNRIGLLLALGGLLVMTVSASWSVSIVLGARGDPTVAALVTWWGIIGLLPAIALLFPAVGILFPDERLPGPGWRRPVAAGAVLLGTGVVIQGFAPWTLEGAPNPIAIDGIPVEASEVGGGVAALGTFLLFAIAVAAVILRYRRSVGVERVQQKWLVASLGAMAIVFPLSFATDVGPAEAIDLLSVFAGVIVPVAVGIAVLRYHVFEIDRVVSRGIAYGLLTAVLVATYAAVILLLQGPLGAFLGGDTISVALSTLVVAALFQPLRGRVQRLVDRRFDRANFDAELTSAAFSERLRDEVDIGTVTADLDQTVRDALKPAGIGLWLRNGERAIR